ncbi:ABC transporter ATP-binding protein [Hahella sp. CCB-MM4]|uniref:ABC transporter ATP-binding protein n=1 Tax=Hahella sp. (strain CCB-MM4) TaxID=1926491 RepID=UPI000B9C2F58|nr:ABC transporter ATP-binding protein [Hahella sp. CCB-MM4]OZG75439.1 ABC transporter ATP-binding protein [Hahella sp. CCB-MM4]
MAAVTLENVSKSFGKICAADQHNLEIRQGEFFVLLGPTGVGKTTLLRMLAGLDKPDQGRILLDGKDASNMAPYERDLAFVFQQYSLYPHMNVYDNLAFPLRSPIIGLSESTIKWRIEKVAELLKISHKLKNKATALSGGEMQRVAIGRALVREPSVYLMDEPLSSLDAKLRADLRIELKRIHEELGATFIYVTHDQIEAMSLADRIGIMNNGKLMQIGTPQEIYENPNSVYVAQRLGQPAINLLPVEALADQYPESATTIGLRTENIQLDKSGSGAFQGMVDWIEHLGDQNRLHVKLASEKLEILASPDSRLAAGDAISLTLKDPLFFNSEGHRI